MLDELAEVAFAPLNEAGEENKSSVKPADKLKALEMLAKRMESSAQEAQGNPLAGLTTEELRRLVQMENERVSGVDDGDEG